MSTYDPLPVLLAREGPDGTWLVWCPYCLKEHSHGSETPPGQGFCGFLRAVAETTDETADVRERVLAYVRGNPWSSTAEVDRGAHVRTGEAAQYLSQLEATGVVQCMTGVEAVARGRARNARLWGVSA